MRTFEEIVKQLGEIELDSTTHALEIGDFESHLDFYLESVRKDSYEQFLQDTLSNEELEEYGLINIWNSVEEYIKGKVVGE